jgi:signal transduction histidine kinase
MRAAWRWRFLLVLLFLGGFLVVLVPVGLVQGVLQDHLRRQAVDDQRRLLEALLGIRSESLAAEVAPLFEDPLLRAAPCEEAAGSDRWREWLERVARRTRAEEVRVVGQSRSLVASLRFPDAYGTRIGAPRPSRIPRLVVEAAEPARPDSLVPRWFVSRPLPLCPWLMVEMSWPWQETAGWSLPPTLGDAPVHAIRDASGDTLFVAQLEIPQIPSSPFPVLPLALLGGVLVAGVGWILLRPLQRRWEALEQRARRAWEETRGLGGTTQRGEPPQLPELLEALAQETVALAARAERMAEVAGWREVGRALGHEIRNALTPLRLTLGSVALKTSDPGLAPALEAAARSLERVQALVEEFSRFARLPQGVARREDLSRLVAEVVRVWNATRPVGFQAAPEPLPVLLDPTYLERILGNLLENAARAAGREGRVEVRVVRAGDRARVRVWNSGPPIPEEHLEEIFARGWTTSPDGQGLGLAVARELCTRMGGKLWAENAQEGGVAFWLDFPLSPQRSQEQRTKEG